MARQPIVALVSIGISVVYGKFTTVAPTDARLHWFGRKLVTQSSVRFDWIGVGFSMRIAADSAPGTVTAELDGQGERFSVYTGANLTKDFIAAEHAIYTLAYARPAT
jgi:hypothetical protein